MNTLLQKILQQAAQNFQSGNYSQSQILLKNILQIEPKNFHALHLMGLIYGIQNNHELAANLFQKAVNICPNDYSANFNLAKALSITGKRSDAIRFHKIATKLGANNSEAWLNYGNTLSEVKQFEDAISQYNQAIKLNPQYADAWYNKGAALQELKQFNAAIAHYDEAIKLMPQYAEAWYNKGVCLHELEKYDQAIISYDHAIDLNPTYTQAWSNKGLCLHQLMSFDSALSHYNKAIELDPNYSEAYWNKAITCLTLSDYKNGWALYDYRWNSVMVDSYRHKTIPTLTNLENIHNKKILIWYEQGLGDTIQFSRFISDIQNQGANVTLEAQEPLIQLLKASLTCEVIQTISNDEEFDYQIPLLSLPRLLRFNPCNIPTPIHINLDATLVEKWKYQLKVPNQKLNIGLAVSGNPNHKNDSNRSIPLSALSKIFEYGNFFLIQKKLNAEDEIVLNKFSNVAFLGNLINDFTDTASIISNMDIVISVDTSLIHLAGSMNKKSLLLLPWCPDWRWETTKSSSLWYRSIKVFRQNKAKNWDYVVEKVKSELNFLQSTHN